MKRTRFVRNAVLWVAALIVCGGTAVHAQDHVIDMLRSDLRAEKTAFIEEEMQFTQQEADGFWPVYKRYEAEIRKVNDERVALIKKYADHYENMTDAVAAQLAKKSLELDVKEAYVRKNYFREFSHVLPATRAAKFIQLDGLINTLVRAQVVAELPFVE